MIKVPSLISLSFILFFHSAHAEDTRLIQRLRNAFESPHAINWESIIPSIKSKTFTDQQRFYIQKILENEYEEFKDSKNPTQRLSAQKALIEYGHFAVESNGNLSIDALNFYEEQKKRTLLDSDQSLETHDYLNSLVNASTPKTLEMMTDFLRETQPINTYQALVKIESMISNTSSVLIHKTDFGNYHYKPNLSIPILKKSNQDQWINALKITDKKLVKLLENHSLHTALKDRIPQSLLLIRRTLKALEENSQLSNQFLSTFLSDPSHVPQILPISEKKPAKPMRELALIDQNNSGTISIFILVTIFSILSIYLFYRKKYKR